MLKQKCQEPDAPGWMFASLANMYRQAGEKAKAITYYQRALSKDYGQVGWRYRLAGLLADKGAREEALRQAEIILQSRPEHRGARGLIAELSVGSASGS